MHSLIHNIMRHLSLQLKVVICLVEIHPPLYEMMITDLVRHHSPYSARITVKVTAYINETALTLNHYVEAFVITLV